METNGNRSEARRSHPETHPRPNSRIGKRRLRPRGTSGRERFKKRPARALRNGIQRSLSRCRNIYYIIIYIIRYICLDPCLVDGKMKGGQGAPFLALPRRVGSLDLSDRLRAAPENIAAKAHACGRPASYCLSFLYNVVFPMPRMRAAASLSPDVSCSARKMARLSRVSSGTSSSTSESLSAEAYWRFEGK